MFSSSSFLFPEDVQSWLMWQSQAWSLAMTNEECSSVPCPEAFAKRTPPEPQVRNDMAGVVTRWCENI